MRHWTIGAVALAAALWLPPSASAQERATAEMGTVVATIVGVVAGSVVASTVVAGTTATVVGAAIGGGLACWWYDGPDSSEIVALPRKSALQRSMPSEPPAGVTFGDPDLRLVSIKR